MSKRRAERCQPLQSYIVAKNENDILHSVVPAFNIRSLLTVGKCQKLLKGSCNHPVDALRCSENEVIAFHDYHDDYHDNQSIFTIFSVLILCSVLSSSDSIVCAMKHLLFRADAESEKLSGIGLYLFSLQNSKQQEENSQHQTELFPIFYCGIFVFSLITLLPPPFPSEKTKNWWT